MDLTSCFRCGLDLMCTRHTLLASICFLPTIMWPSTIHHPPTKGHGRQGSITRRAPLLAHQLLGTLHQAHWLEAGVQHMHYKHIPARHTNTMGSCTVNSLAAHNSKLHAKELCRVHAIVCTTCNRCNTSNFTHYKHNNELGLSPCHGRKPPALPQPSQLIKR